MKRNQFQLCTAAIFFFVCGLAPSSASGSEFVALPESSNVIGVLEDNETFLEFTFGGWGPNWQWLGFRGEATESDAESRLITSATVKASGATLRFDRAARASCRWI